MYESVRGKPGKGGFFFIRERGGRDEDDKKRQKSRWNQISCIRGVRSRILLTRGKIQLAAHGMEGCAGSSNDAGGVCGCGAQQAFRSERRILQQRKCKPSRAARSLPHPVSDLEQTTFERFLYERGSNRHSDPSRTRNSDIPMKRDESLFAFAGTWLRPLYLVAFNVV